MEDIKNLVQLTESQKIIVGSKQVAEHFKKNHQHVLRDIEKYQKDVSNFGQMFEEAEYSDAYGRKQRQYLMNRDGFSLLAMGFTGKKALEWKLKYINAFNQMEAELNSDDWILARALTISNNKLQLQDQTIKALQASNEIKDQQIGELKPKADYTDRILKSKSLVTTTQIAKDYGMSGRALNQVLNGLCVQYKQSGQWLLYRKHHAKGYTHSETIEFKDSKGLIQTRMNTKWTQKGRLFIYETLKTEGILPLIEQEGPGTSS